MFTLTKEMIEQAQDLQREFVETPEWKPKDSNPTEPCGVWVQCLTGADRDAYELRLMDEFDKRKKDPTYKPQIRSTLLAWSIVDEAGERLFAEKDIEAIGKKNYMVLDRIKDVAERLNGLTQKEMDELEKNS